jgi:hypothetical protein
VATFAVVVTAIGFVVKITAIVCEVLIVEDTAKRLGVETLEVAAGTEDEVEETTAREETAPLPELTAHNGAGV